HSAFCCLSLHDALPICIFYEFIPMGEWDQAEPQVIPLGEVELGRNYAMLITTNAGLWRYKIGDTVTFTSVFPYRIRISGRTKHLDRKSTRLNSSHVKIS